ncbi:MAG: Rrf2 family protein [Myxococcota bacterium]
MALIRLSKKSEYALMALAFLSSNAGSPVSAKDISAQYRIPPALLAKVMQVLKRAGIVQSAKGVSGGYSLAVSMDNISFLEFLEVCDEPASLVECLSGREPACQQLECCEIRDPVAALNEHLRQQLGALSLAGLFEMEAPVGATLQVSAT